MIRPALDRAGPTSPSRPSLPFPAQARHERRIPVGTNVQKKLFTPVQIGPITLKHRVVMPPMSRLRAQPGTGIPSDLQLEYYTQRASDGGLIVTEATAIAASARGYYHAPGLYADDHVAAWKRITDAVHAKGAYFFTQLWHAGRTTHVSITGSQPVTASVDPTYWADPGIVVDTPDGFRQTSPHRALETAEIASILDQYRAAARNAKKAGFDGVELMAANGHLMDQFLQDNTNKRTDQYGGTVENRMRLLVEVVQTLIQVWGADRVGVRLAPSGTFNHMGDSNPRALFRSVAEGLGGFGLAYLHLIEPRVRGGETIAETQAPVAAQELSKIFKGPVIAAGGFNPETAEASIANGDAGLIAFGRHFIANPDLPRRIKLGLPLNPYDRSTFYGYTARGYTDYPAYDTSAQDRLPTS
ncbi:alkene reductase [Bradyrhizobium erythrophlei]|uniref:alkene reductase n=1 Tax=Bradyrhizobium erythrophlei TaxID=1437360 RepID=UPI001FCCDEBA|nr:alkene reductase [Bradyrhizobium erythrophlei]